MSKDKDKKSTSGWTIFLYVLAFVIALAVVYYLFERFSSGNSANSGNKHNKSMLMKGVASVMLVLILYYVFHNIYSGYQKTMDGEPWLVETTKNAQHMTVVPAKKIPRSSGGRFGLEFSYSMWIYINQWNSNDSRYKNGMHHVLHKGSMTAKHLQCPGIWLEKNNNVLVFKINTFHRGNDPSCKGGMQDNQTNEECWLEMCKVPNIPVHKWVHVTFSVINKNVDVYVNGFLKKRCILKGLPWQNEGDIYLNAFNGFNGYLSRVRYFNYALPVWKIEQVVSQGPSDAPCVDTGEKPPYLARDWWQTTRYPTSGPN